MYNAYLPLLIVFLLALGLAAVLLVASNYLGPKRFSKNKSQPFECGNLTSGVVLDQVEVKFYLVGILFLVFDIEAVFIYPWAMMFQDSLQGIGPLSPIAMLLEMAAFVAVVLVGLNYVWRRGALEWSARVE